MQRCNANILKSLTGTHRSLFLGVRRWRTPWRCSNLSRERARRGYGGAARFPAMVDGQGRAAYRSGSQIAELGRARVVPATCRR